MTANSNDALPFSIIGDFKKACRDCRALDIKAETLRVVNADGAVAIGVSLSCYNAEVCRAIESRPKENEMPCRPGDQIWYANGQVGVIKEIALCAGTVIIRCEKFIDGESYDVEQQLTDIGTVVFLSHDEMLTHRAEKGSKQL